MTANDPALAWLTHIHNRWTGFCRCGAGPFITAEHRAHVAVIANKPTSPAVPAGRACMRGDD